MNSHHTPGDLPSNCLKIFFVFKVVESCVEQIRKPNPEIYKRALERLNVNPEDAIFLDDFGQNLKPARELGIHTIKVGFVLFFLAILCFIYFLFSYDFIVTCFQLFTPFKNKKMSLELTTLFYLTYSSLMKGQ